MVGPELQPDLGGPRLLRPALAAGGADARPLAQPHQEDRRLRRPGLGLLRQPQCQPGFTFH